MPAQSNQTANAQESVYPVIESFVEQASSEEVARLFDSVKDGLGTLKGPRAEYAKKVEAALARTEELLSHLIQVRENLEADRKDRAQKR